jgi:PBP1b-binding outer membrane lipoprotein LpoB
MRASIIIALVIVSLLMFAACTKELPKENTNTQQQQQTSENSGIEPEADTAQYIDSQIVDPAQEIEIGEMI